MKFIYATALFLSTALASPQLVDPLTAPTPAPAAADARQVGPQVERNKAGGSGASLGNVLGMVDVVVSVLGEQVPDLKKPAEAVNAALLDFANVAKGIEPAEVIPAMAVPAEVETQAAQA